MQSFGLAARAGLAALKLIFRGSPILLDGSAVIAAMLPHVRRVLRLNLIELPHLGGMEISDLLEGGNVVGKHRGVEAEKNSCEK